MKLIKNYGEFESLTEEIKKKIEWYDRTRNFEESTFVLYLANGENVGIKFARKNLAHLFGINTDYLRSTGLFGKLSSYEILMKICNNPYETHKYVRDGYLTYRNFISDYYDVKLEYFIDNCGINFNDIEFICKY